MDTLLEDIARHNEQLERRASLHRCTKDQYIPVSHAASTNDSTTFEQRCIKQALALLRSNMPAGFKCEQAIQLLNSAVR